MARFVELLVGGAPGFALFLSTVLGYGLLILALFGALRRSAGIGLAAATSLTLVFCPEPVNYLSFEPCRVWSIILVFAAIYVAEHSLATSSRLSATALGLLAGLMGGLALYTDLFVTVFLPGMGLYGLAWAWGNRQRLGAILAAVIGLGAGLLPIIPAHLNTSIGGTFNLTNFARSWPLFWDQCFPFLMGLVSYAYKDDGTKDVASTPGPIGYSIAILGIACFLLLFLSGIALSFRKATSPGARRLAWLGGAWILVALVGFLFSDRAYDVWGARYLAPVLLGLPFAAAPAIQRLRQFPWVALAVLAPIVASFAAAGWRSYGTGYADGLMPRVSQFAEGSDERQLFAKLAERGVTKGIGDYWIAHRLTFLSREQLIVSPTYFSRYPPYDAAVANASKKAFLFNDAWSNQGRGFEEAQRLEQAFTSSNQPVERIRVGRYTALIPAARAQVDP